MIKFTDGELLDYLPSQMKNDTDMICLSYALKMAVRRFMEYEAGAMTQAFVENAPEHILDALAVELRAPYYEQRMGMDVKRRLIREALPWYMKAGTAAAMKELINAVFGGGEAVEWFDLAEGEARPGEFDVTLGTMPTDQTMYSFIGIINAAKNVRSHLRRMLVTLSGPLDGPDLLDGRTEKGKYGVEILYILTYYAEFVLTEALRCPGIRFQTGMDFWETRRHNGRHRHDGHIFHRLWRRYNLEAAILYRLGALRHSFRIDAPEARFHTGWATAEGMRQGGMWFQTGMLYWYDYDPEDPHRILIYDGNHRHDGGLHHDGIIMRDGSHRHERELAFRRQKRRYGMGVSIGMRGWGFASGQGMGFPVARFAAGIRTWEGAGASARFVMAMQFWDMVYHDGVRLHDGSRRHDSRRWRAEAGAAFKIGMDFWETWKHNGKYLHDGSVRHRAWRRYGIGAGATHGTAFHTQEAQRAGAAFLSGIRGGEGMEASMFARSRERYFHNGGYAHNGAARHRTVYRKEILT